MRTLATYEPLTSLVLNWIAKETEFHCRPGLGEILSENKRLVVAISHSSPLSWLPSVCLLAANAVARGGGRRRPIGVMDRAFFHVPFVNRIAQYLTQSERPLSSHELVEHFELFENVDLIVFPEGSNCFFGNFAEIQDFRSPKFVEIAVRVGAPILICVHRGSEHWAASVPVGSGVIDHLDVLPKFASRFLEKRLKQTGLFTLPLLPKPMERFAMLCEVHQPQLKASELSEDAGERREQILAESERIRLRMKELLAELESVERRRPEIPIGNPG